MRFHCGFSFNWKIIKKWLIPILLGVLLLFSQKLSVYALTESGDYESGDSVKANFKIGTHNIGANDFYSIPVNSYDNSNLNGGFVALSDLYIDSNDPYNYVGQTWVYFAVDFCRTINGYMELPYKDYGTLDYTIDLNSSLYLSNDWWNNAHCWRSFVHFRMNYRLDMPLQDTKRIYFYNTNYNYFRYHNTDSAINNLRYIDLIYLSSEDYYKLINESKNGNNINDIRSYLSGIPQDLDDIKNDIGGVKDSVDGVKDSITDSSIATGSSASSYFGDNIWLKNYGISSLITIPIDFIQNLTNETCTPISLNLPFVENKTITLPCISTLMSQNFSGLFDLYQLIIGGFIGLYCGLHIYRDIEDAINPFKDMPVTQLFIG